MPPAALHGLVVGRRVAVKDRVRNTRATIMREAAIMREAVRDVRERLDLDAQVEPRGTRGRGGLLGQKGSLAKTPFVVATKTADNVISHVQGFARINRRA